MSDEVADDADKSGRATKRRAARLIEFDVASYRFSLVLLLLFVTYFFIGISPAGRFGPLVTIIIESVTLLVTLSASGARRIVFVVAVICSITAISAGIAHASAGSSNTLVLTSSLSALLILVAPFVIIASVIRRRTLDVQTVLAALCLYVMLGFFFTYTFTLIQGASTSPFFSQMHHAQPGQFLYFSFATITTVGYGDLTAATGLGRSLATFEAMVGQLYLVTVVALLVSNLGAARFSRARAAQEAAASAEAPLGKGENDG